MHFDWSTLILQTVNVLVLLWLLRRFLFRPMMAIIAERKNAAEKLLTDAATARDQSHLQAEQTAQQEKALAADGDRIMAAARLAAEAERAVVLEQAKTEAAQIRDAAKTELEQQRGQMHRDLEVEAQHLAVTIASRLLGRVPAQALNGALLDSLGALSPEECHTLAALGETLELVTSVALDAATQVTCTDVLQKRLGCAVRFGTDPSLIAGFELRGTHATLHNNWRADLDRIAEELSHDDNHIVMA
jgi:F-type H+-transporting ATPase subunit b